ncbi:hypothetical protein MUK42_04076 [Musa troglodytarum]|uniref:Uncharacterized protein n=1 Tax=Musa troglodytarum TaxID=320322 RepID=A0A9E7FNR6_9LILI|nr:hypothetical protein MUK42_04076 [Musa troglodytarum]
MKRRAPALKILQVVRETWMEDDDDSNASTATSSSCFIFSYMTSEGTKPSCCGSQKARRAA